MFHPATPSLIILHNSIPSSAGRGSPEAATGSCAARPLGVREGCWTAWGTAGPSPHPRRARLGSTLLFAKTEKTPKNLTGQFRAERELLPRLENFTVREAPIQRASRVQGRTEHSGRPLEHADGGGAAVAFSGG